MDYKKVAQEIYDKVGRKENIVSAAHCATRLRLVLVDNAKCDAKAVENIEGVKGVFSASGQLQVILGTGVVDKVYDEFIAIAGISAATKDEVKAAAAAARTPSSGPSRRWATSLCPSSLPSWPAASSWASWKR